MPHKKIQGWQKYQMKLHWGKGLSLNAISKKVNLSHQTVANYAKINFEPRFAKSEKKVDKDKERRKEILSIWKPTSEIKALT